MSFCCQQTSGKTAQIYTDYTDNQISNAHTFQLYEQGEKISGAVQQVLTNTRRIISFVVPESDQSREDFQDIPQLPLTSEEHFDEFEIYLNLKPQKQLVVKFLTSFFKEGMTEDRFVQKILPELISNSFARCISWERTVGTKIRFVSSKLNNAIRLAVLKIFTSSDLTQAEFRIQRWFNTSAQRTASK